MATQTQTTGHTIKLTADRDYPWSVLDEFGNECDAFATRAEAEADRAERDEELAAERAEEELDLLQTITQELAAVCQDPERLRKAIAFLTGRA